MLYELERALEATQQAARGITGRLTIGSVRTGLAGVLPGGRGVPAPQPPVPEVALQIARRRGGAPAVVTRFVDTARRLRP